MTSSCLTNFINFSAKMPGLVDEERAEDVVYLDFTETFDTVSHKVLRDKLLLFGLDREKSGLKSSCMSRPRGW